MKSIFNVLSTISSTITLILFYCFIQVTDNNYFNGYTILIILLMLLNPMINIFRLNKKIVTNPLYHLFTIIFTSYMSCISLKSLLIYNQYLNGSPNNSMALNNAINYFNIKFIYFGISILLLLLLQLLLKKQEIKTSRDKSPMMIIIISITFLIPIILGNIWRMNLLSAGFNIAGLIFSVIVFFKLKKVNTSNELRGYYLVLSVTSIFSINPVALVISIFLFVQLDKFGLHI